MMPLSLVRHNAVQQAAVARARNCSLGSFSVRRIARRSHVARAEGNMGLVQSLVRQVTNETLPWLRELVDPWGFDTIPLPETRPPRELATPSSRFKKVNGVDLHYFETGAPSDSEPSVFMWHGYNGSVFQWRYIMDLIQARGGGRHLIAFDRPPFGLSERPTQVPREGTNPYSSKGSLELARGLLQSLGARRTIHVGHSAGANLALKYALQHPDEVEALILISPAISTEASNMPRRDAGAMLRMLYYRLLLGNDRAGLRYVQRRILKSYQQVSERQGVGRYDNAAVTDEDIKYYLLPAAADNWDRGALLSFRAFEFGPPPDFDALKVPVLIVEGLQDEATTPTFVRRLVTRLQARPHGETKYVELDNCGHVPMEEYPTTVLKAMDDILDRSLSSSNSAPSAAPSAAAPELVGKT